MGAALAELLSDDSVRGVVLTGGVPGVFIRHADVSQIIRAADALVDGQIAPESFIGAPFPKLGDMLDAAEKPVIAAIDGLCMGGGFEIALACTARIASPAATAIGLPEIRIWIFPGSGGTQRLARIIGRHRARLFMLQGAVVDAAKALELGLVDEVVPNAVDRAVEMIEGFARRPVGAVAAIMRMTKEPAGERLDEELVEFAELIRDDASVRAKMEAFVAGDLGLNEIE